jgi:hypothetical protein
MTFQEAINYVTRLKESHPEGCSCGAPDCLCDPFQRDPDLEESHDDPYEAHCASIVRDQTDWDSEDAKRLFCEENDIECI